MVFMLALLQFAFHITSGPVNSIKIACWTDFAHCTTGLPVSCVLLVCTSDALQPSDSVQHP